MPERIERRRAALPSAFAVLLAAALVAAGASGSAAEPAAAAVTAVKPTQELALLLSWHTARSAPDKHSRALQRVGTWRPLTNERTALPVLGHKTGRGGVHWLHVRLPGRPNSHAGWILERATLRRLSPWHLTVDLAMRRVTVYDKGRVVRIFRGVVGKPSTPTPSGEFFVEESLELRPGDVGAPFALALSARSNVFQEFEGGPGQIALHGTANVGGVLGTAASHGCVRLDGSAMTWLATRIGPGVPVTITD